MSVVTTNVLVVEDNPADVRLLQEALRDVPEHGLTLSPVGSLCQALSSLERNTFDAALLDLSLPDAEGLEIVFSARAKAPRLPIIVLTGRDDSDLAVSAVRNGAQDYLVKGRLEGHSVVRSIRYAIERRRALDALERSERQFRALIENSHDLIAVLDAEWRLDFVSPSVERIIGHRPSELLRGSIIPLIHPDDLPQLLSAVDQARRIGELTRALEIRLRHKDGSWHVLECWGRSLFDDPVIGGLVLNAHDISERKAADLRLRIVNAQLTAVIDNAPLAILQMDRQGRLEVWNKGAERIFGWASDEIRGRPVPYLTAAAQADFEENLRRACNGEVITAREVQRMRRDGSILDLNLWTALLRSDAGDVRSVLAIMADVTEQKKLEVQFRHAQKLEAVGRLAGGVAHDFNNLLTVINGYVQLAMRRMDPGEAGFDELQEVLAAADRAAGLTKQLLALSRRQISQPVLLDLSDVVAGVERMLRRMVGESVDLQLRRTPGLPRVMADRSQIELVLLNLAANARDAMPSGGKLLIETLSQSTDTVSIRVSDNGMGMSPEVLTHMFEPFFTTKEEGKGTGLGLSTSYTIVRQHGGEVLVSSVPDEGATFEIRLPVASEQNPEVDVVSPVAREARGNETVLLVEDDHVVARVMCDTLEGSGYSVLITSAAGEALAIARDYPGPIHLLLCDMVLRGGHGVDVADVVHRLRPETAVLFVSGYPDSSTGVIEMDPGAEFLPKPFSPQILTARVRDVLDRNSKKV